MYKFYPEAVEKVAKHIKVCRGYGETSGFDFFQASTILAIIFDLDKEMVIDDLLERTKL